MKKTFNAPTLISSLALAGVMIFSASASAEMIQLQIDGQQHRVNTITHEGVEYYPIDFLCDATGIKATKTGPSSIRLEGSSVDFTPIFRHGSAWLPLESYAMADGANITRKGKRIVYDTYPASHSNNNVASNPKVVRTTSANAQGINNAVVDDEAYHKAARDMQLRNAQAQLDHQKSASQMALERAKAQGDMNLQNSQMQNQMQLDQAKSHNQMQMEQAQMQNQMQLEQSKSQANMQLEQSKLQNQMQLEQSKAQSQMQMQQMKLQNQMQLEQMRYQTEADIANRAMQYKLQLLNQLDPNFNTQFQLTPYQSTFNQNLSQFNQNLTMPTPPPGAGLPNLYNNPVSHPWFTPGN